MTGSGRDPDQPWTPAFAGETGWGNETRSGGHSAKTAEPEFRDARDPCAFLFGSLARDQAHDTSGIDVFFDLARSQGFTLLRLVALKERMQKILGATVELIARNGVADAGDPALQLRQSGCSDGRRGLDRQYLRKGEATNSARLIPAQPRETRSRDQPIRLPPRAIP